MTSRIAPARFTKILGIIGLVALCGFHWQLPVNLALDPFSLWHGEGPRNIVMVERTNKFLLSYRYIPQNFDGVLMGPSFSANFDTRLIAGRRIYNLSLNGGNATELLHVFTPAASTGKLRYIVISMDPYIFKNGALKDDTLRWTKLEAALTTMESRSAAMRALDLKPVEDVFADSAAGWNNFDLHKQRAPFYIDEALARTPAEKDIKRDAIPVHTQALQDFKAIVDLAHAQGIKVFAYYFPQDAWHFTLFMSHGWADFRATVDAVFGPGDVVWDMNTPAYDYIRRKGEAYTDGHLSQSGAALVMAEIQRKLDAHLPVK